MYNSMDHGYNGTSLATLLSADENGWWDWNDPVQSWDPWSMGIFDLGHGQLCGIGFNNSVTIDPSTLSLPAISPNMLTTGMGDEPMVPDDCSPKENETALAGSCDWTPPSSGPQSPSVDGGPEEALGIAVFKIATLLDLTKRAVLRGMKEAQKAPSWHFLGVSPIPPSHQSCWPKKNKTPVW